MLPTPYIINVFEKLQDGKEYIKDELFHLIWIVSESVLEIEVGFGSWGNFIVEVLIEFDLNEWKDIDVDEFDLFQAMADVVNTGTVFGEFYLEYKEFLN